MKKLLILGIIILFVGTIVIPSTARILKEKTIFTKTTSRGYIQGLIDNASNDDIIYIPRGIYYENIIINKSISLVGEDKNTTIIDGSSNGDVILINADWVNISGFTIRRGTNGVLLHSTHNTIKWNNISNNIYGIKLEISSSNTITSNDIISNNNDGISFNFFSNNNVIIGNNIISNNNAGIYLSYDSSGNTIIGNNINSNYNDGIYLYESYSNTLTDNSIISNNNNGICLYYSIDNTITNNNILNNNNDGIYLDYSNSNTIISNNINSNYNDGIYLYESYSNTLTDNSIISNNNEGIIFSSSGQNYITENSISNNIYGIKLEISSGNTITSNDIISNNNDGIYLDYSSDNTITSNNISNNNNGIYLIYISDTICSTIITNNNISLNNNDGISFSSAVYNTVTDNTISSNKNNGISLSYDSHVNFLTGNNISNNNEGIIFSSSGRNYITENSISNSVYGIKIDNYSNNNEIYHNNFMDNTDNAYDEASNTWDDSYPFGGNYWDDYTGPDINDDEIGDIPYNISGGDNLDLYPFMEQNGWLKEPEFKKAIIFGRITNLSGGVDYISFYAEKTRIIMFKPFSFRTYVSGETWIISEDFWGFIGKSYIFVLCNAMIKV